MKIFKINVVVLISAIFIAGCAANSVISKSYDFKDVKNIGILKVKTNNDLLDVTKDLFARELMKKGFTVIERARIKQILKEKNMTFNDSIEPKNTKKLGNILGVKVLLMAEASYYPPEEKPAERVNTEDLIVEPIYSTQNQPQPDGSLKQVIVQTGKKVHREERKSIGSYTTSPQVGLTAKMVDVETAEIVWVGTAIKSDSTAMEAAESGVNELVEKFYKDYKKALKNK